MKTNQLEDNRRLDVIEMKVSKPANRRRFMSGNYLICNGDSESQTGSSVPTRLLVHMYWNGATGYGYMAIYCGTGLFGALTMAMRPSESWGNMGADEGPCGSGGGSGEAPESCPCPATDLCSQASQKHSSIVAPTEYPST
uniref:HDC10927 n=1 Tax=Drosophila melanogaster TaxID=7227 RepID=Q6IL01_DROME|nr:TPA_inf: HDC10927 [Drosophila melanogaster]